MYILFHSLFLFLFPFLYSKFSTPDLSYKFEYNGMHIYVFIYLLIDQYSPINWICTKERKPK
jgi:hypothetical protein